MVIRRALLAGVAAGALITYAKAADMPLKAARAPGPSVFAWNGFYAGLFMGAGVMDQPDGSATMQRFTGAAPGTAHPLQAGDLSGSGDKFPLGGVTFGYNRQIGRYVWGLETDIAASKTNHSAVSLAEGPITYTVAGEAGYRWLGTLRARFGYLYTPATLLYITGGLAFADIQHSFTQTAVGPGPVGSFTFVSQDNGWKAGWVVGAGFEQKIDSRWSLKAEYQYVHFDSDASGTTLIQFNPGKGGNAGVFAVSSNDLSAHTARLGLNYAFWMP
jgi:outer membrane immunogenic protein